MTKKEENKIRTEERKKAKIGRVKKSDIEKLLVLERAKSREKFKQSKFMSRTLSIYNHQKDRARELGRGDLPYTLDEFRVHVQGQLDHVCIYCNNGKVTLPNMACDHRMPVSREGLFTLENLVVCHKACNFRKGCLTDEEYKWLNEAIESHLPPVATEDIRRRLTSGGKWIGQMQ